MIFLLLEDDASISKKEFQRLFKREFRISPQVEGASDELQRDLNWIVNVEGRIYSIILVGARLPVESFKVEIAFAHRWPHATDCFGRHKSHVLVSLLEKPSDFAASIASASNEIKIASILSRMLGATSFICSESRIYQPASVLEGVADNAAGVVEKINQIMVGLHLTVGISQDLTLLSFGLSRFVGFEFEASMSAAEARAVGHLYPGLVSYLLKQGPVLRDGDTVGETANEKVKVVFMAKGQHHRGRVAKLRAE